MRNGSGFGQYLVGKQEFGRREDLVQKGQKWYRTAAGKYRTGLEDHFVVPIGCVKGMIPQYGQFTSNRGGD